MAKAIPVGAVLVCPGCGHEIATFVLPLANGDALSTVAFKWHDDPPYTFGSASRCRVCEADFFAPLVSDGVDAENVRCPDAA